MTDKILAQVFVWDGEAFYPVLPRAAERQYVKGERYNLVPKSDRSAASHGHFFAAVEEAWGSLGDNAAARFPTPTHLRKFALIRVGWFNEAVYTCGTLEEAERAAAMARGIDDFAVVTVDKEIFTCSIYRAKSQREEAMDKREFQKSKQAALEYIADLIGVTVDELSSNAGQSA